MGAARQWTNMIISDPQTPAGAREPRRGVERTDRRERQGLSGCRRDAFLLCLAPPRSLRWCWCSAACTPGGQFDPTEALSTDIFSTKKKLAGRTRAALPAGRARHGDWSTAGFGERLSATAGASGCWRRQSGAPARCGGKAEAQAEAQAESRPYPAGGVPSGAVAVAAGAVFAGAGTARADQLAIAFRPTRADQLAAAARPARTRGRPDKLAAAARPARTGGRPDKLAAAARPARTGGRRPDKLAGAAAADAVRRKTALASLA